MEGATFRGGNHGVILIFDKNFVALKGLASTCRDLYKCISAQSCNAACTVPFHFEPLKTAHVVAPPDHSNKKRFEFLVT